MSFPQEIIARLVAQSAGTYTGSTRDIFLSSRAVLPDGDGPFLSVNETGGTGPARTHSNATQKPSAQLVARADTYSNARAKLKLAYDALGGADGLHNVTLSGTAYISITANQEPFDLGLDSKGRAMVAVNIAAEKKPS